MLFKIVKSQRQISTGKFGNYVQLLSLPNKRVGLLNAQGHLLIYDLYKSTINKIDLKSKILRIYPYNDKEIIILCIDTKSLYMFNIKTEQKYFLTAVPTNKIGDNYKDSQILFLTQVKVFRNTGHIAIFQKVNFQLNIITILKDKITPKTHSIHQTGYIIQQFNEDSKIAVYRQDLQANKKWKYKIIDIANNFEQIEYQLNLDSIQDLAQNTTVNMIRQLNQQEVLIFLNNDNPGLYSYQLPLQMCERLDIQIKAGLEQIIIFDKQKQIMMLSYVGCDQQDKTTIDMIDLKNKKLILQIKQNTQNLIPGWQHNFLINQKVSDQSSISRFWLRHLVRKSALIMHLLMKTNIMKNYGNQMCRKVIQLNADI